MSVRPSVRPFVRPSPSVLHVGLERCRSDIGNRKLTFPLPSCIFDFRCLHSISSAAESLHRSKADVVLCVLNDALSTGARGNFSAHNRLAHAATLCSMKLIVGTEGPPQTARGCKAAETAPEAQRASWMKLGCTVWAEAASHFAAHHRRIFYKMDQQGDSNRDLSKALLRCCRHQPCAAVACGCAGSSLQEKSARRNSTGG